MAEEPHAPKAEVEALPAAQGAKDAAGLGNTKPRLDAAKTEISAAIAEVSGKVERLPPKPPEKPSKAVARKRAKGGRGDAFDPSKNPTAPGAPRPLGTIAPAATPNNSAAEIAYGQRAN